MLSLPKTCEEEDIKKRHRELVRMVHPDKLQLGSDTENAKTQQAFRAVQVAYETLITPHKRKSYDLTLSLSSGPRFVPGESTGEDSPDGDFDEGPSVGAVLLLLVQIVLSVAVYLGNEVFQDVCQPSRALVLYAVSLAWSLAVFYFGVGFFYAWGICACVYAIHALVGIRKMSVYVLLGVVLQGRMWNERAGLPVWYGLTILTYLWTIGAQTLVVAASSGVMSALILMMSILLPQFSFGAYAMHAGLALATLGALALPLDVYFAIFVAVLSWHFLQGLPSVCLAILGLVVLYIVLVLSKGFCILVLSAFCVCISSNYLGLLISSAVGMLALAVNSWGWSGALKLSVLTWGLRRSLGGQAGGKRMVMSVGLVWCLNCGWLSGTVCMLFICVCGEVLKVAAGESAQPGAGGDQAHAHAHDGSPSGGAAGAHKKHKKKK